MSMVLGILVAALASGEEPADIHVTKEKMICKRVYNNDTGSHFKSSKRICAAASAWKEQDDETQRSLRAVNERGSSIVSQSKSAPAVGGGPK